jgi:multiple antibiotic resistance protein
MTLSEYVLFALSSLFVIMDPIATVPVFLAMTTGDTTQKRIRTARLACILSTIILLCFAFFGQGAFRLLGITIPAFQMAASIVLLLVSLDMLRAQRSRVVETHEETQAGVFKDDIAVTPLAVPLLAGPGAISTAVLLHNKADTAAKLIALPIVIAAICLSAFAILYLGARGAKWLTPITLRLIERLMGLLLASIAVQFFLNALRELRVLTF